MNKRLTDSEKKTSCCIRGLDNKALPGPEETIKKMTEYAILKAISQGYTIFKTILDPGFETWAAEIVLKLRESNSQIRLECVIPYPNYQYRKNSMGRKKSTLDRILQQANLVTFFHDEKKIFSSDCTMYGLISSTSLTIGYYDYRSRGLIADYYKTLFRKSWWNVYELVKHYPDFPNNHDELGTLDTLLTNNECVKDFVRRLR